LNDVDNLARSKRTTVISIQAKPHGGSYPAAPKLTSQSAEDCKDHKERAPFGGNVFAIFAGFCENESYRFLEK
jgi:hypothetical protein